MPWRTPAVPGQARQPRVLRAPWVVPRYQALSPMDRTNGNRVVTKQGFALHALQSGKLVKMERGGPKNRCCDDRFLPILCTGDGMMLDFLRWLC